MSTNDDMNRARWQEKIKTNYEWLRRGYDPATGNRSIPHVARMPGNALSLALNKSGFNRDSVGRPGTRMSQGGSAMSLTNMTTGGLYHETAGRDDRGVDLKPPLEDKGIHGTPSGRSLMRAEHNKSLPVDKQILPGESYPGLNSYVREQGFADGMGESLLASALPNRRTGKSLFGFKDVWRNRNAPTYIADSVLPSTDKGLQDMQDLGNAYLQGRLVSIPVAATADTATTGALLGKAIPYTIKGTTALVKNAPQIIKHPTQVATKAFGKIKSFAHELRNPPAVDIPKVSKFRRVVNTENAVGALSTGMGIKGAVSGMNNLSQPINTNLLPQQLPVAKGYGYYATIPNNDRDKYFDFGKYPVADSASGSVHMPYSYHMQEGRRELGDDWYYTAREHNVRNTMNKLWSRLATTDPEKWSDEQKRIAENWVDMRRSNFRPDGSFIHRSPGGDIMSRDNTGRWDVLTQYEDL